MRRPSRASRAKKQQAKKTTAPRKFEDGLTVNVEKLGMRGDGIAQTDVGPVFIPYSVPGDTYTVYSAVPKAQALSALAAERVTDGPNRIAPPCPSFGTCGGCLLQHLEPSSLAETKRDWLVEALHRRGISDADVAATMTAPPGSRRRARFAAVRTERGWLLGFNERQSARVLNIENCLVLLPALSDLIAKIRSVLPDLPSFGQAGDVQVTACETGIEICFYPRDAAELTLDERYFLTDWANDLDIARICWSPDGMRKNTAASVPEPVIERRPILLKFGGADSTASMVAAPPAPFLQPSAAGEQFLTELVLKACAGADRVADLFCGCGSFTVPLAEAGHTVHAVDIDAAMLGSLRRAMGGRVSSEVRDLGRHPISARDFEGFGAVVFDPPRAGAEEQAKALAQSDVPVIVAVSCNPTTLARDLRILIDEGYRLEHVTPVDQFTYSAHLEAVAILRRPPETGF